MGLWVGLALTAPAFAATQHEQMATETMQLSGADAFFKSVQITAEATEGDSDRDPLEEKILEVMNEPLDVAMGKKILAVSLAKNLDDETLGILLKWYRRPLWKKIKAQKAGAPRDPLHISRLQYLYELKTKPPTQERVELLKKFAKGSKSIEMMYEIIARTGINLARITSPARH